MTAVTSLFGAPCSTRRAHPSVDAAALSPAGTGVGTPLVVLADPLALLEVPRRRFFGGVFGGFAAEPGADRRPCEGRPTFAWARCFRRNAALYRIPFRVYPAALRTVPDGLSGVVRPVSVGFLYTAACDGSKAPESVSEYLGGNVSIMTWGPSKACCYAVRHLISPLTVVMPLRSSVDARASMLRFPPSVRGCLSSSKRA